MIQNHSYVKPVPMITNLHRHTERPGLSKLPHYTASVASGISGIVFPAIGYVSNDKIPFAAKQNLRPIFTEEGQAEVVHHVIRCAHIHSGLHVTTEFHRLDGLHLEQTTEDGCPTTSSKTARMVLPALFVASFVLNYRVLPPSARTYK